MCRCFPRSERDQFISFVCDNDFEIGQLFNEVDKYSFVFVNLEENEPVAKAEMLSNCCHLLRLKKYMEKI